MLSSRGEFFHPGSGREHMNQLDPRIAACAHYFGVAREKDIHTIAIEYQEFKDERHEGSKAECRARVVAVAKALTHQAS